LSGKTRTLEGFSTGGNGKRGPFVHRPKERNTFCTCDSTEKKSARKKELEESAERDLRRMRMFVGNVVALLKGSGTGE